MAIFCFAETSLVKFILPTPGTRLILPNVVVRVLPLNLIFPVLTTPASTIVSDVSDPNKIELTPVAVTLTPLILAVPSLKLTLNGLPI